MPFFNDLKAQFFEWLAQQTKTTRTIAGVFLAVVLALLGYQVAQFGSSIDRETVYAGLSAEEAALVRTELATRNVDFEMVELEDGWSIRVPVDRVPELRLDLVSTLERAGEGKGWKLFDEPDFGVTYFSLQIKKQRAIMGELSRTIKQFEMVKSATVAVTQREEQLFVEDEKPVTASVLLTLVPGPKMSADVVRTIQKLVAGSIEGLSFENVTVADTKGNELSRVDAEDPLREKADNMERIISIRRKQSENYEQYLEDKILSSFSQIFGRNHVTANVSVEFDYTMKKENEIEYEKTGTPVSTAYRVEGTGDPSRLVKGVVGSAQQSPPPGAPANAAGAAAENQEYVAEDIRNHLVGQKQIETIYPEYQIKRITAAVILDDFPTWTPVKDPDGKDTGTKEITRMKVDPVTKVITDVRNTLTDLDIENFENQVRGIINYSEDRPGGLSDTIYVTNRPFTAPIAVAPETVVREIEQYKFWRKMVYVGFFLFLTVLVFLMVVRPLMRIISPKEVPLLEAGVPREGLPEEERILLGREEGAGGLASEVGEAALPPPRETSDLARAKMEELDDSILELARINPKKVPVVIRAWMEG